MIGGKGITLLYQECDRDLNVKTIPTIVVLRCHPEHHATLF